MNQKQLWRLFFIGGIVLLLDQVTKQIVFSQLALNDTLPVFSGFFNLTHVQNPGGAFGFLANQHLWIRKFFFIFVSGVVVIFILVFYQRIPDTHPWLAAAMAMILGGAAGNLLDRIRLGKVIDFLDFHIGALHWPAFNVADSAITIGITIVAIHLFFDRLPE
ncbi:MAG: signal peptidase II [Deltaproteobacteria bacterium]|nr:MAG: signal peptidase II [Deltaproteobacteria bacterium]